VRYLAILCVALVAIAFFLVASSSSNPALFAERYPDAARAERRGRVHADGCSSSTS
jgi:hypothetical protein